MGFDIFKLMWTIIQQSEIHFLIFNHTMGSVGKIKNVSVFVIRHEM